MTTVDSTTNPTLKYQYGTLYLIGDGTNWYRIDRHTLASQVDVSGASSATSGQVLTATGSGTWEPSTLATPASMPNVSSLVAIGHNYLGGGFGPPSPMNSNNASMNRIMGEFHVAEANLQAIITGGWAEANVIPWICIHGYGHTYSAFNTG